MTPLETRRLRRKIIEYKIKKYKDCNKDFVFSYHGKEEPQKESKTYITLEALDLAYMSGSALKPFSACLYVYELWILILQIVNSDFLSFIYVSQSIDGMSIYIILTIRLITMIYK